MSDADAQRPKVRALEQVLRAERDAERDVDAAKQEAEEARAEARQRAQGILARADARIIEMRSRAERATARDIEALAAETEAQSQRVGRQLQDPRLVDAAIARVVDWLLGVKPPEERGG